MNHFKGKQFKKDVIIVAVGYYLRYNLTLIPGTPNYEKAKNHHKALI